MMITNDQEYKRWVNGTLGIVSELSPTKIKVTINGTEFEISPVPFNKYKCEYDREERKEHFEKMHIIFGDIVFCNDIVYDWMQY